MSPVFPIFDRGEPPEERPEDGGQGSQGDCQGEPNKINQQDQDQDQQEKEHPEDTNKTNNDIKTTQVIMCRHDPPKCENITSRQVKVTDDEKDEGDQQEKKEKDAMSSWEKLSSEEKLKKRKIWDHRKTTLEHFEIPPYSTPPRNAELDVSLDNDNGEEDQEVLDDLENEEKEEQGLPNANENKTKHDCDGFGCPFVIQEQGTWNIRCMMDQYQPERDEQDRRELMEAIDNDATGIRMAQASQAAQEDPASRFLLREPMPVPMGMPLPMPKHLEVTDVVRTTSGPEKTIKIYCAHNDITCKVTASTIN